MISNNSYVRTSGFNDKLVGVLNTIKKFINVKNIIK